MTPQNSTETQRVFATGCLCVSVAILCLCGVMVVYETASSRLWKNVGVVHGAWFARPGVHKRRAGEVQGQQMILDAARSVPSNREPSTLNRLGVFQHPATSHPNTWEIVNFGLRIGSSEKIRHSQFEIRNAEVLGRILVIRFDIAGIGKKSLDSA